MSSGGARRDSIDLAQFPWSVCAHAHVPDSAGVQLAEADAAQWKPFPMPCDVLTWLRRERFIADPYAGFGDLECGWVEELDWAFRVAFEMNADEAGPDTTWLLTADGIDCWGEVYVNGKRIGSTDNQFHPHRFVLDEVLKEGANDLVIYVRSALMVNAALEQANGRLPAGFDSARVHARRCQCATGWDWAARMSGCGVLGEVRLERERLFRLESPFVHVRELRGCTPGAAEAERATIAAEVDVAALVRGRVGIAAEIIGPDGVTAANAVSDPAPVVPGLTTMCMDMTLDRPLAWWPLAMGPRNLYTVRFTLSVEGAEELADTCEARFAVRTTGVVLKKDSAGESFTPHVNGVPVFCRGANWVPARMLPGEVTDADCAHLVSAAAAAGMNCLRVWGGGVYERDAFYNACDRLGILVWQDFMFACAAYPDYRDFRDSVEKEAEHQLRRLRNHPCIMLWCGNNENEWLHQVGSLRIGDEKHIIGESLWSTLLREKCEQLDPSRPYHQSSPFGRNRSDCNDQASGDRHHWDAWGQWHSPSVYLADTGRFISEFGFQSFPDRATVRMFAPEAAGIADPVIRHHQKGHLGIERMARYAVEMRPLPADLDGWVDASQQVQAEAMRRAVTHWRRRKHDTAGALIWQLNDAYPALSWSMIDFCGRPKAVYEAARHFFAPVMVAVTLMEDNRPVGAFSIDPRIPIPCPAVPVSGGPSWQRPRRPERTIVATLVNDTCLTVKGTLAVTIARSAGDPVHIAVDDVIAEANGISAPCTIRLEEHAIADVAACRLDAHFQPSPESLAALEELAAHTRRQIQELLDETPRTPEHTSDATRTALLLETPTVQFDCGLRHAQTLVENRDLRA